MVGFAQVFVTTSQMSATGLSPEYTQMSSSLSWVMLDVNMPFIKSSSSSQNGTTNSTSTTAGRRRLYERVQADWGLGGGRHQVFVLGPRGSAAFLSVDRLGIPAEMDPRRRSLQAGSSTQPGLQQLQGVSFESEIGNQLIFSKGMVVGAASSVPGAAATFAAAQAQANALKTSVTSKFNLSTDPYVRVQEVVFIVWLGILAITVVQILLVRYLKQKNMKVPVAIRFPKPQLMLALFIFPAVAGAAAGCFKDGSPQAVGVGVLLLLTLPVPLLAYILYIPIREILLPHSDLRRLYYEAGLRVGRRIENWIDGSNSAFPDQPASISLVLAALWYRKRENSARYLPQVSQESLEARSKLQEAGFFYRFVVFPLFGNHEVLNGVWKAHPGDEAVRNRFVCS